MYRYYDSFADDIPKLDDPEFNSKAKKYISDSMNKIENIEMIVEGKVSGDVSVGLSANYIDGTTKTIYNKPMKFPKYENISLVELEFEDVGFVTLPNGEETEESSTSVFRDIDRTNPDNIDAIIDTFNSMMNTALQDSASSGDNDFYFHATIKNGKGVID
jgi:hypothetical protein